MKHADWILDIFRRNQDGVGRRGCARFVYLFSFPLLLGENFSITAVQLINRYLGVCHILHLNRKFFFALLQILARCLHLARAVSWTTNFGFAMMQSSTSLVETSIPPSLQVALTNIFFYVKLSYRLFRF